jgi:hypothetical protein
MMFRNPSQHGSGTSGEPRDKSFTLKKGNEPIFVCMWINMLMIYEIHAFATGAENVLGGEDEPNPNGFNDNADYEVAMKEYNIMIEKLNKGTMRFNSPWDHAVVFLVLTEIMFLILVY